MTWYEVKQTGARPQERFSHASTIAGTSLVIFGGINKNFCGAELYSLELDPYKNRK